MLREAFKALVSGFVVYAAVVMCNGGSSSAPVGDAVAGDAVETADGSEVADPCVVCEPAEVYAKAGSRLRPVFREGADGSRTPQPAAFWDTAREEICYVAQAADGRFRCLPPRLAYQRGGDFSDNECTVPAATVVSVGCPTEESADAPTTAFKDATASDPCPRGQHVFRLGEEVPREELYRKSGEECTANPYPEDTQVRAWVIGEEIPPSAFVEITLTHD